MQESQHHFVPLAAKTVVCHTVTYFVTGAELRGYHQPSEFGDATVDQRLGTARSGAAGLSRHPVCIGLLPVSRAVIRAQQGMAADAWMLIGIGILGTFAAPAGSLEGFIFTTSPALSQAKGYLEVVTQAVLLSAILCYWVNHSGKKWMNWTLGAGYAICAGLPLLALVAPRR
jgi:hypothetical protein